MTHIQSYLLKSAHFLKFNGSLENRKNLHLCVSFLWLQSAAKHITITGADVNKSLYDPEVVSALCHLTAVYYCDLEMWVRGHWRSLKMVPFESMGTSVVTIAVSSVISEIFSVKEWSDLEIWVWGRSRSLKMARSTDHVWLSIRPPL